MGWSWIFDLLLTRSAPAGLSWGITWRALAGKPLSFQPGLVVGGSQKFKGKTHFAILFAGMRSGNLRQTMRSYTTLHARALFVVVFRGPAPEMSILCQIGVLRLAFFEKFLIYWPQLHIFLPRGGRGWTRKCFDEMFYNFKFTFHR